MPISTPGPPNGSNMPWRRGCAPTRTSSSSRKRAPTAPNRWSTTGSWLNSDWTQRARQETGRIGGPRPSQPLSLPERQGGGTLVALLGQADALQHGSRLFSRRAAREFEQRRQWIFGQAMTGGDHHVLDDGEAMERPHDLMRQSQAE